MAAILMNSTEFAQQMEGAGIPRAQADVIAKGLATMVVHNFDALVTKDYLDTRFDEFEARMGREMDRRFAEQENRMQHGFAEQENRMQLGFAGQEKRMQLGFAEQEKRMQLGFAEQENRMQLGFAEQENRMQLGFAEVNTRFARVNVMLAVIMAGVAVPVVQSLVSVLGN